MSSLIRHFLATYWACVMRPEPRLDAVLVVKVLARKLMDFIFVNEFLEADLAVFDIHQI